MDMVSVCLYLRTDIYTYWLYWSVPDRKAEPAKRSLCKVFTKEPHPNTIPKITIPAPTAHKKKVLSYPGSQSALRKMGNSARNPIDIDAIDSRFEPSVVKGYVSDYGL